MSNETGQLHALRRSPLLVAGVLTVLLGLVSLVVRVPRGWWAICPVIYAFFLVGLAVAPSTGRRGVVSLMLMLGGGILGIWSIFVTAFAGMLVDERSEASGNYVNLALLLSYLLTMVVLFGGAVRAVWWPGNRGDGYFRLANVLKAALAIALLQATWFVLIYFD